jgi:hypothetical protein
LWGTEQDSARWSLISKNNFGHSALTVNDAWHLVEGMVEIEAFDPEGRRARLDLTPLFGENVERASRTFRVLDDRSVEIRDHIEVNESTRRIRWQMTTQSDLLETEEGLLLQQDGESLRLTVVAPEGLRASVKSLELPEHPMDKTLPNLKRIDLVVPAHLAQDGVVEIVVRLSGGAKAGAIRSTEETLPEEEQGEADEVGETGPAERFVEKSGAVLRGQVLGEDES